MRAVHFIVRHQLLKKRAEQFCNFIAMMDYGTNVDDNEVEHHNKLAADWWDKANGEMRGLHALNVVRLDMIRKGLINVGKLKEEDCVKPNYLQGMKILDVGCGGGILTISLAELGADVTGLDPAKALIQVAKDYASKNLKPETTVQFIADSIENFSAANYEIFDVVFTSEVLEHVPNKQLFLKSCVDTLKPNGSIFITTVNRNILAWFVAIFMGEYVTRLIPVGTHHWSKLVKLGETKNYLKNVGCKTLQTWGLNYVPLFNIWHFFPLRTVFYAVHAIKQ